MKPIRCVEFQDLDGGDSLAVQCVVFYVDGSREVFIEEEDFARVWRQLQRQALSDLNQNPARR